VLFVAVWLVALLDVAFERYLFFTEYRLRRCGVSIQLLDSSRLAVAYYSNCSLCICKLQQLYYNQSHPRSYFTAITYKNMCRRPSIHNHLSQNIYYPTVSDVVNESCATSSFFFFPPPSFFHNLPSHRSFTTFNTAYAKKRYAIAHIPSAMMFISGFTLSLYKSRTCSPVVIGHWPLIFCQSSHVKFRSRNVYTAMLPMAHLTGER
jgi:hypothetical protein